MPSEKRRAVFLDRDGVINRETGEFIFQLEEFIINEGLIEALKVFQQRDFIFIVISNQSGIARGLYTKEQADYLHLHLQRFLKNHGIVLSEIYYCPHHPDDSNCICRKPDSGLLEKAIARFHIDAGRSYFIGDAERDIKAGEKAGVNSILIKSNTPLLEIADRIV